MLCTYVHIFDEGSAEFNDGTVKQLSSMPAIQFITPIRQIKTNMGVSQKNIHILYIAKNSIHDENWKTDPQHK